MKIFFTALVMTCLTGAFAQPYGGVTEGVINIGNVAVITIDLNQLNDPNSVKEQRQRAYDFFRNDPLHSGGDPIDMLVSYGHGDIDQGPNNWRFTDPITPGASVAIPHMGQTRRLIVENGGKNFFSGNSSFAHEVSHHWVTFNLPTPKTASGTVTSGGTQGVLIDANANFTQTIYPQNDYLVFPNQMPGKMFKVTQVVSDTEVHFDVALDEPVRDHSSTANVTNFCPDNPGAPFTPSVGNSYDAITFDFAAGPQCVHYDLYADGDGSFTFGNDYEDLGNGSFRYDGHETRFSPMDLWMMGFLTDNELPSTFFVLKNAPFTDRGELDIGEIFTSDKRTFTRQQMIDGYNGASPPPAPKNYRQRYSIITTIGAPVGQQYVDALEEIRIDWVGFFKEKATGPTFTGTMTASFDESLPDLGIFNISGDLSASPLTNHALTVKWQNQSGFSTGFGAHKLKVSNPWPLGTLETTRFFTAAHQILTEPFTFAVPDEATVFGSNKYKASYAVDVTVDSGNNITEADENHNSESLDVAWLPSYGNRLDFQSIATSSVATDGANAYFITSRRDLNRVALSEDPKNPVHDLERNFPSLINDVAANKDVVCVGKETGGVEIFDLPITLTSTPVENIPVPGLLANMVMHKDVIYTNNFLNNNVRLIVDVSKSGGASLGMTLVPNDPLHLGFIDMHVDDEAKKLFLGFFQATGLFIEQYDITIPETPVYERTHNASSLNTNGDITSGRGRVYISRGDGTGVISFDHATGAQVGEWIPPAGVGFALDEDISFSLDPDSVNPQDYLILRTRRYWTHLEIDSTTGQISQVGRNFLDIEFNIGPQEPITIGVEDWSLLYGREIRMMSPRGISNKFIRGDANGDGTVDFSDAQRLFDILFGLGEGAINRELFGRQDAGDVNDDGIINISDPQYLLSFLSSGGPAPPAPYPAAGADPTSNDPWEYADAL